MKEARAMNRGARMRAGTCIAAMGLLSLTGGALAQQSELPPLEIEDVTVIGRTTVVLPKARKGEVIDTSVYLLPPGNELPFGERISSLGGNAGPLPVPGEFDSPIGGLAEGSIGSYLSPRALARLWYGGRTVDAGGVVDFRGTNGHVDSAEASSLELGGWAGVVLGEGEPPLGRFRLGGDLRRIADSYYLFGNSLTPFDRSRTTTSFSVGLRSQGDRPVGYHAAIAWRQTDVSDRLVDTIPEVSATEPGFNVALQGDLADRLRGSVELDFATTSLRYSMPTNSPSWLRTAAAIDWEAAPGLFATISLLYATGQSSDSGSSDLVMPRGGVRYEAGSGLSFFASFAPELRRTSYHDLVMRAPYVDREIVLRPERVPISLRAGARFAAPALTVQGNVFYEKGENSPVVVRDSLPGDLHYAYVGETKRIGLEGSVRVIIAEQVVLDGDLTIGTYTDTADRALPMLPTIDLRARAGYRIAERLDLFATLLYQDGMTVALAEDAPMLETRFLLGGGAGYSVMENLEITGEVTNLLNLDYQMWDNYVAPGIELRGGVRVRW